MGIDKGQNYRAICDFTSYRLAAPRRGVMAPGSGRNLYTKVRREHTPLGGSEDMLRLKNCLCDYFTTGNKVIQLLSHIMRQMIIS